MSKWREGWIRRGHGPNSTPCAWGDCGRCAIPGQDYCLEHINIKKRNDAARTQELVATTVGTVVILAIFSIMFGGWVLR